MIAVDDRLDIEVEEVEKESNNFDTCIYLRHGKRADWVLFFSCGHAYGYCEEHANHMEEVSEQGRLQCKGQSDGNRIVRKEPAR